MKRNKIIEELGQFFRIEELVCPHTFKKFGYTSWQFFDRDFLENLLILRRDVLKEPMIVNDWFKGGIYSQRGFRCNICQLVKQKTIEDKLYLTAHANGAAIDAVFKDITAEQARDRIRKHSYKFTVPVRIEKDVSWLHFDVYDPNNGKTLNEF